MIIITAGLIGLALGVYNLVLPLWLKAHAISYVQIGWIFAVSNGIIIVVPIAAGQLADRFGWKRFFAAGIGCCAVVCLATPTTVNIGAQVTFRVLQRAGASVYQSLQDVLVFQTSRRNFTPSIRLSRGVEGTCHAIGAILVWVLIRRQTGSADLAFPLLVAGGLAGLAFILVMTRLRASDARRDSMRTKFSFRITGLPRELMLLGIFNFVFMLGLSISHSHMMILFFYDKFSLAEHQVAWVSMAHRLSLGLPMVLAAFWRIRPNKWWFAIAVVTEGSLISLTVLPSGVVGAVSVWLLHDPFGATIWIPMNSWYMQRYARPNRRAMDVTTVMAMSTLGTAVGPIIAGHLVDHGIPGPLSGSIDLPFFVSGLVVVLSAGLVCLLPTARPNDHPPWHDDTAYREHL